MRKLSLLMLFTTLLLATPKPPSDLTFDNITKNSVTIHWSDNSDDEIGFKIFRDSELIYTTKENVAEYRDSGLDAKTTYTYTVKATNNDSEIVNTTGVVINELLAGNINTKVDPDYRQYSDYIELHNSKNSSVDIGGFYLSDDKDDPKKYKIPSNTTIPANGYILIWADKEDTKKRDIHTNFSLSLKKEYVTLANRDGDIVDEIKYKDLKGDISIKSLNGNVVYMIPTPKTKNSTAYSKLEITKEPTFSKESGFYSSNITVTLTQDDGADIYYTLDGSTPTKDSTKYNSPITIDKTTVIRAKAYKDNLFVGKDIAKTYLINENISIPVVSLSIDSKYLYDDEIGIYTKGNHDNYEQDWMRSGYIEYIKDDKVRFSGGVGVKIHGNNTRVYPQKSLSIYAKSKYGTKSFKNLFSQKPHIKKSNSFVLRNGGTEWARTLIGDAVQHTIVKDIPNIDYQAYEDSVILFLNGKYWGIHNIREKMNDDYLKDNHHIDKKKLDLLENHAEVKKGSNEEYLALENFVKSHDMKEDSNYNYVVSKIDEDEFINYYIIESFVGNSSTNHNIKYWRIRPDGKWRWMLFDLDRGFRYDTQHVFEYILDPSVHELFIGMFKNSKFRSKFVSRYYTYMQTIFTPASTKEVISKIEDIVEPEIDRHFKKWPKNKRDDSVSKDTWRGFMDKMYEFANYRYKKVYRRLGEEFNLHGEVKLNIQKPVNGTITIDSIELNEDFNGLYFSGATVTLKAIPKDGYSFVGWSNANSSESITISLDKDISLSAEFK
jgi:hypothetical protein